jgi:hypothetical protein
VIHNKVDKQDIESSSSSSSTVLTNYYASLHFEVQVKEVKAEVEEEQLLSLSSSTWHVRLGDIVAVSFEKKTPQQIQEWHPKEMHLPDDT